MRRCAGFERWRLGVCDTQVCFVVLCGGQPCLYALHKTRSADYDTARINDTEGRQLQIDRPIHHPCSYLLHSHSFGSRCSKHFRDLNEAWLCERSVGWQNSRRNISCATACHTMMFVASEDAMRSVSSAISDAEAADWPHALQPSTTNTGPGLHGTHQEHARIRGAGSCIRTAAGCLHVPGSDRGETRSVEVRLWCC